MTIAALLARAETGARLAPEEVLALAECVEKFSVKRVVLLGDFVADEFQFGDISRVSREAPVHAHQVIVPDVTGLLGMLKNGPDELVSAIPAAGGRTGQKTSGLPGVDGLRVQDDHAGDDQIGIVERGAEGVGERVAELASLVDRSGRLGRRVAR